MKKTIFGILCGVAAISLGACSTSEQITHNPYLDKVTSTGCLNDSRNEKSSNKPKLVLSYEDENLYGAFENVYYACDFGRVHVEATIEDGQISLLEYPENDMADCMCPVNCDFIIKDLAEGTYQLKIFAGNTRGEYNASAPYIDQKITVKPGMRLTIDLNHHNYASYMPYVMESSISDCKRDNDSWDSSRGWYDCEFEMAYDGEGWKCKLADVWFDCGFDGVDIDMQCADQTITIGVKATYPEDYMPMDCRCRTDVDFKICDVKPDKYTLKIAIPGYLPKEIEVDLTDSKATFSCVIEK